MEVESEESEVELDMEGVLDSPDQEQQHEMGDSDKKEMSEEEMEKFDEKRGEAMGAFSEVGGGGLLIQAGDGLETAWN